MDRDSLEGRSLLIDLEFGRVSSEEEASSEDLSIGDRQRRNSENGPINCLLGSNISVGSKLGSNSYVEVIIRKEDDKDASALVEKKYTKKNNKKMNFKKASKPPRPPKGPALDASDMVFMKEISAHAMNKRARVERIKALRKMREENSSRLLSKSSLCAMIFTILFLIVICIQGFCSKGVSSVNFHGSPEPATNGLISVQFFSNPSANDGSEVGSSSSPEEQIVGSDFRFHQ